ncbi:hypothetical protein BDZ89DRAFT_1054824, partial [Hymenopellis radicata]
MFDTWSALMPYLSCFPPSSSSLSWRKVRHRFYKLTRSICLRRAAHRILWHPRIWRSRSLLLGLSEMLDLYRDSTGRVPVFHQFTLEDKRCVGYNILSQRPTSIYPQKPFKLTDRDANSPAFDITSVTKPETLNPAAPWRVFYNLEEGGGWVLPEKWVVRADEDMYQALSLVKAVTDALPFPNGHPRPPALYDQALSVTFETRYGAEVAAGFAKWLQGDYYAFIHWSTQIFINWRAYLPNDVVDRIEALRF